eukprot:644688-Rhodomonas_salina.1
MDDAGGSGSVGAMEDGKERTARSRCARTGLEGRSVQCAATRHMLGDAMQCARCRRGRKGERERTRIQMVQRERMRTRERERERGRRRERERERGEGERERHRERDRETERQ